MEQRINPNLPGWIVDHLTRYIESDGEDGHMWDASVAGGEGVSLRREVGLIGVLTVVVIGVLVALRLFTDLGG